MTKLSEKKLRRRRKNRAKIQSRGNRLRISVHRSLKHIRAQIIDDKKGKTLLSMDDIKIKDKGLTKTEKAKIVGEKLGRKAKLKKITQVCFDRGSYKYHGRVKALAAGLRATGLKF